MTSFIFHLFQDALKNSNQRLRPTELLSLRFWTEAWSRSASDSAQKWETNALTASDDSFVAQESGVSSAESGEYGADSKPVLSCQAAQPHGQGVGSSSSRCEGSPRARRAPGGLSEGMKLRSKERGRLNITAFSCLFVCFFPG